MWHRMEEVQQFDQQAFQPNLIPQQIEQMVKQVVLVARGERCFQSMFISVTNQIGEKILLLFLFHSISFSFTINRYSCANLSTYDLKV